MVHTDVQLSEEQFERLSRLAAQRSISLARLLVEGAERMVEAVQERRWQRLWQAIGTCHDPSGEGNVALEHDRFLAAIYDHGRDLR